MNNDEQNNNDLYSLKELSEYKVADGYADVRDWEVRDTDDRSIGRVDSLLVSRSAEKVVYLDVEVNEKVIEAGHTIYNSQSDGIHEYLNKDGEDHLIIPIGMVTIDDKNRVVRSNEITHDTFSRTKRFKKGTDISRDYEQIVFSGYFPDSTESIIIEGGVKGLYDRKEYNS